MPEVAVERDVVVLVELVPLVTSARVLLVLAKASERLKSLYIADLLPDLVVDALLPDCCLVLTATPPLELDALRDASAVRVLIGFRGVLMLEAYPQTV